MRVKVKVSDLIVGKVYPSALYTDETNIIIPANVPVKQSDIDRMKRWKIEEVEYELPDSLNNQKSNVDIDSSNIKNINKQNIDNQNGTSNIVNKGSNMDKKENEKLSPEKRKELLAKALKLYSKDVSEIEKNVKETKKGTEDLSVKMIKNYNDFTKRLNDLFFEIKKGSLISHNAVDQLTQDIINLVKSNKYELLSFIYNYTDENVPYLVLHSINVTIYSIVIGIGLEYPQFKISQLVKGALFHDCGMLNIKPEIIQKEGKLTDEEFKIVKQHPILGQKLLNQKLGFSSEIANVALEHHERYNGSGYPSGLKGDEISAFGRVVAIADSYDAMTQKRSYKTKYMSSIAIKSVLSAAKNLYDPNILRTFLSIMSIYPIGSLVQLNNGIIGLIIRSNPKLPLRPVVKVLMDEFGEKVNEKYEIDLEESNSLYITQSLDPKEFNLDLSDILD
ncbi:MAG: HD-GYP domain-containing protein [Spirochaetes bacterium]|nr:HD-GYP domain-containing protein [Spirochaetota bacterium]